MSYSEKNRNMQVKMPEYDSVRGNHSYRAMVMHADRDVDDKFVIVT